jgi:hypothetical protein
MHNKNTVAALTESSGLDEKFYKVLKYCWNLSLKLFQRISIINMKKFSVFSKKRESSISLY